MTAQQDPEIKAEELPQAATKCIYFPDKRKIDRLQNLLSKRPRASMSSLFAQLLDALVEAIEGLPDNERRVKIDKDVWL